MGLLYKAGGGGAGQNYFLRELVLNWREAVCHTLYLSKSEINHLYVPNILMLCCLVLYFLPML